MNYDQILSRLTYERDDEGEDAGEGGVVVLPIADGRVGGRLAGHHPGGPEDSLCNHFEKLNMEHFHPRKCKTSL